VWRRCQPKLRRFFGTQIILDGELRRGDATTVAVAAFALIALLGLAFGVGRVIGHRAGAEYCRVRVNQVEEALDALREADISLIACESFLAPLRPDKWKTKTTQQKIATPKTIGPCKNCGGGP
jgi:hypothetical protein